MTQAGERGVSVVIPAYNASAEIGETIEKIHRELSCCGLPLEVLVVDDGSTDATSEVVGQLPGTRLLRNARNRGKGWAVYRGVTQASFSTVCFTDADGPFLPGSYRAVIDPVLHGAPFVIGSRRLPGSAMLVSMGALNYAARRHLIGIAFNRLVRFSLPLEITDTQCGLKAFERSVGIQLCQRVRSLRYLFDVELLLAARVLKIPVTEVAVSVAYRDRKTSLRLFRDCIVMGAGIAAIAWRAYRGVYRHPNADLPSLEARDTAALTGSLSTTPH